MRGAESEAGHVVETVVSATCVSWEGTPQIVSLNERDGQVSFRTRKFV